MKFFKDLFSDNNSLNEKSFIGFLSFLVLCIFAMVDIISGFMGHTLTIHEFIFNGFEIIVLGAFGIAATEKITNIIKNNIDKDNESK
jgi:hypothetical protein